MLGSKALLETRAVAKRYGGVVALRDADLSAYGGEVLGLLGENGAGKSTLIKILSGSVRPDGGAIWIEGRPVHLRAPRHAVQHGIATAFQELSLVPDLSVAENLFLPRIPVNPIGMVRRSVIREARAALAGLDVADIDVRRPVASFSLAVRQKIEVARALIAQPRVLILDEPTAALPKPDADWVLANARRRAEAGACVILVSHRLDEVQAVADRLTVFRSGETVLTGLSSELSGDAVVTAMLGRRIERLYPHKPTIDGPERLSVRGLEVGGSIGPIDLDVRTGEIVGIAAMEGQGEREILFALAGALPSSGSVRVDGRQLKPNDLRRPLKSKVVLVPRDRQRDGLFFGQTVAQNISAGALPSLGNRLGMINGARERRLVTASASSVAIDRSRLATLVDGLSGGNQQKVLFARALAIEPRVLLLYDCTRGIDIGTKAEMYELLRRNASNGLSALMYSSDLNELVNVCDRVLVLRSGRIVSEFAPVSESDEHAILRDAIA